MKKVLLFLSVVFLIIPSFVFAAEVRNLVSGQSGDRVYVQYDLVGKLGEKTADVAVTLEINGEMYPAAKLSLEGDFGKAVAIGRGKRFYWRFLRDYPAGFEGDVTWDVTASGDPILPQPGPSSASPATKKAAAITAPVDASPVQNSIGMTFVLIPKGAFQMGSSESDKYAKTDETPQHPVTISRPFYLQTTEVTQGQWKAIMETNPSYFRKCGDDCPVEQVSWQDVQVFIEKLNQKENTDTYRLPTEAEWEYAARSGAKQESWSGTGEKSKLADFLHFDVSSTSGQRDDQKQPLPVKSRQPNSFRLYDMSGNAAEWVGDWYRAYSAEKTTDPQGPPTGIYRVHRGGSFADNVEKCRTSARSGLAPASRDYTLGFRLMKMTVHGK